VATGCWQARCLRKEPGKSGDFSLQTALRGYHQHRKHHLVRPAPAKYSQRPARIIDSNPKKLSRRAPPDTLRNFTN